MPHRKSGANHVKEEAWAITSARRATCWSRPSWRRSDDGSALAEHGRDQRGMVSAEWAVGIVAAVAIAGVLLAVITSGPVEDNLLKFILKVIKHFVTVAGI